MTKITAIEGISATAAKKLEKEGITTVEGLLEAAATKKARNALAAATKIADKKLLAWVNRADLARVKGIGGSYGDLLEKAGVDSVPELARRKPANLHQAMMEANQKKQMVKQMPSEKQVEAWVTQAKALPKIVKH